MNLFWWRKKKGASDDAVEPLPGSVEARALADDLRRIQNDVDIETERLRAGINANHSWPPS